MRFSLTSTKISTWSDAGNHCTKIDHLERYVARIIFYYVKFFFNILYEYFNWPDQVVAYVSDCISLNSSQYI